MTDKIRLTLAIEGGVTQNSLENAEYLNKRFGKPYTIDFCGDEDNGDYYVIPTYKSGYTHVFTGFSWGYGGEGPRGLHRFLNEICGVKIPMDYIARASADFVMQAHDINNQLVY
jgi:hypothetical protein